MMWDICSIKGQRDRNEDYALYGDGIGACVADGIGGAPLGDALARCACHTALASLGAGANPVSAMKDACFYAERLIHDLELSGSGAALTIVKFGKGHFEAAWLGDVAFYVIDGDGIRATNFDDLDMFGLNMTRCVGSGAPEPHYAEFDVEGDARIAICTDGVWKEIGNGELAHCVLTASTPQEATANLVLGREANDNATALVLFS